MKILHSSDWHGDKSLLGVRRFVEVADAVEQTIERAIFERVSLYLFTGDLCDPDDGGSVLDCVSLAVRTACRLAERGIHSWWLPGNHDVRLDGSGESTLDPLAAIRNSRIRLFSRTCGAELEGVSFLMRPYVVGGDVRRDAVPLSGRATVVATHLSFPGAKLSDETTEMARGKDVDFNWDAIDPSWTVLGGHYHRRQIVEGPGGRKAHICGSLVRHSFGEQSNEPAYSVVEV